MKTVAEFRRSLGSEAEGIPDAELQQALDDAAAEKPLSPRELVASIRKPLADAMTYEALVKSFAAEQSQRESLSQEVSALKATVAGLVKQLESFAPVVSAILQIAERQVQPVPLTMILTIPDGALAPVITIAAPNVTVAAPQITNEINVPEGKTPEIHVAAPQVTVTHPKIAGVTRTVVRDKDKQINYTDDKYHYES